MSARTIADILVRMAVPVSIVELFIDLEDSARRGGRVEGTWRLPGNGDLVHPAVCKLTGTAARNAKLEVEMPQPSGSGASIEVPGWCV